MLLEYTLTGKHLATLMAWHSLLHMVTFLVYDDLFSHTATERTVATTVLLGALVKWEIEGQLFI